jgi:hypothetical protein
MVLALAGDSTMTRLSAMTYREMLDPETKNRGRAADLSTRAVSGGLNAAH